MKKINVKSMGLVMRIPINQEYNRLMDVTHENDTLSHWKNVFSWVNDADKPCGSNYRVFRGYSWARGWSYSMASYRYANLGFRPACDLTADSLPPDIQDGESVILGTLYMGGKPIRVPQNPTYDGDIADYIPDTKLEMRSALADPAYQVKGIYVGSNVFVADRNLLKNISYLDIEQSFVEEVAPWPTVPTENTTDYLPAGSVGFKLNRSKLEERGFRFDDTDDAYLYAAGLVDWLASHSENYTPEQYHRIQSLKNIFASIDYGA